MAAYKMTPARRAAIRKAQAASARKRKKRAANRPKPLTAKQARNRKIIKGVAVGAAVAGVGVAAVYGGKEYQKSDTHYVRKGVSKSTRKFAEKHIATTGKKATRSQRQVHAKKVRPLMVSNAKRRTVKRAPGKKATKK